MASGQGEEGKEMKDVKEEDAKEEDVLEKEGQGYKACRTKRYGHDGVPEDPNAPVWSRDEGRR
jgi:hypothetical protein